MLNEAEIEEVAEAIRAEFGRGYTDFGTFRSHAIAAIKAVERARDPVRADYKLRCEDCGRSHYLDCSLPSEIWNQIARPENVLCTMCIDARLAAKGLKAECEFYYAGEALTSKLYERVREQEAVDGEH